VDEQIEAAVIFFEPPGQSAEPFGTPEIEEMRPPPDLFGEGVRFRPAGATSSWKPTFSMRSPLSS